ncbi:MAG: hypothetical protein AB7D27_14690 [Desulfomicrobium sp.]
MDKVRIPNSWTPRPYQMPLWTALEGGCKRASVVWHRRAGKDSLSLNWTAVAAHERIGVYWHMLPTQKQARKVVWDGIDKNGRRIIDQVFPEVIRAGSNATEMKIELKCGSIWQLCGSDNYNSLVGGNPVGVVFSEWSLADPAAWDFIRPILAENGGWAMFIFTPRGRNHGWTLHNMAAQDPKWFAQLLTVEDTGAIPLEAVDDERKAGMSEEMIRQEFYCSFEAPMFGAYYAQQMSLADAEGRICRIPVETAVPVDTYWDLGMRDSTAIWFFQHVGHEVRAIDYYEASGEGLAHFVQVLQSKGYVYGEHFAPHDIKVRELGSGRSRLEMAESLGLSFNVVPDIGLMDGINAVRAELPKVWFDQDRCARGVEILRQYRKEWDDDHKIFRDRPLHDWTSHGADAFRMFAVGHQEKVKQAKQPVPQPYAFAGGWMGA